MRRDETIIHSVILICFLVEAMLHGFSIASVLGILGLLLIHYRLDFFSDRITGNTKFGESLSQDRIERLEEKINQLNALIALKTGLRPRQEQAQK